jgi:hypothetical protein
MVTESQAEKDIYVVYQLKDITYLPHYTQPDVYVSPGYGNTNFKHYSAMQLVVAGAIGRHELLFRRAGKKGGK